MRTFAQDFTSLTETGYHQKRARLLVREHPEVRRLIGRNRFSFLVILAVLVVHIGAGWSLSGQPFWMIAAASFVFGAFPSHALWVMIHECSHNLIFDRAVWNTIAGIIANLPHLIPSSVSFQRYHMKHHSNQAEYEWDPDVPSHWEARLIGNSAFGKALWLLLFPFFQVARPLRLKRMSLIDGWTVVNILVQIGFDIAIYLILGPRGFAYFLLSFFFSVGLHPLGARWVQEHYLVEPPQLTSSYYGAVNLVAFNIGYHLEHHDLPSVPWNRLPQLKNSAPELYEGAVCYHSWARLLLKFLFDPSISLFCHQSRGEKG